MFQQDGARCHTAALTMQWLNSRNVNCLPSWPSNSPDLSPIEQVWGIMKRFILQWFGTKPPISVRQLDNAVAEAYNNIGWTTVGILMLSVKHRMRACVDRNWMFIGDLVGECCRRARVEFEGQQDVLLFQVSTMTEETNDSFATNAEQSQSRERGVIEQAPQLQPFEPCHFPVHCLPSSKLIDCLIDHSCFLCAPLFCKRRLLNEEHISEKRS